jgi:hypothetical protein
MSAIQPRSVLGLAAGGIALVALSVGGISARPVPDQEPQHPAAPALLQTPTPVPLLCSGITMGGQLYAYRGIIFDLPVGHVYSFLGGDTWGSICVVEYSSSVIVDSMTGREMQRHVNDPRAAAVLDQIARNVTINPMPTPVVFSTPPSGPPAPVTRGLPISPPSTGDAGLVR